MLEFTTILLLLLLLQTFPIIIFFITYVESRVPIIIPIIAILLVFIIF